MRDPNLREAVNDASVTVRGTVTPGARVPGPPRAAPPRGLDTLRRSEYRGESWEALRARADRILALAAIEREVVAAKGERVRSFCDRQE